MIDTAANGILMRLRGLSRWWLLVCALFVVSGAGNASLAAGRVGTDDFCRTILSRPVGSTVESAGAGEQPRPVPVHGECCDFCVCNTGIAVAPSLPMTGAHGRFARLIRQHPLKARALRTRRPARYRLRDPPSA